MRPLKCSLFALLLIASPALVVNVAACSCSRPSPSPYQAYREATAVFIGKVISSADISYKEIIRDRSYNVYDRHFHFVIDEMLKGPSLTEIDIDVGRIDSSCYQGYAIGESYLVYAYGNSERFGRDTKQSEEILFSGACTRSSWLKSGLDDIHFIRDLLAGKPEPTVYGSVARSDNVPNDPHSRRITYLEGIKVVVEGAQKSYEVITDKDGLFTLATVPPGEYTISPVLPSRYTAYFPTEEKITVNGNGYSSYAGFTVGWNNELTGRVLDANGQPIRRAVVRLLSVNGASESMEPWFGKISDYLGPEARYEINSTTPGNYILAVEVYAPFVNGTSSPRSYYPQTTNPKAAKSITISEASRLNLDIKLPGLVVRDVPGIMVWSDGSPVTAYSHVALESLENSEDKNNQRYDLVRVGKDGRFVIQAFENADYWIKGEVGTHSLNLGPAVGDLWDKGIRDLLAKPLKLQPNKDSFLRLVIPLPPGAVVPR